MKGIIHFTRSPRRTLGGSASAVDANSRRIGPDTQNCQLPHPSVLKDLPALPLHSPHASRPSSRSAHDENRADFIAFSQNDAKVPIELPPTPPARSESRQATEELLKHQVPDVLPPDSPISLNRAFERSVSPQVSPVVDKDQQMERNSPNRNKVASRLPVLRKPVRLQSLPSHGQEPSPAPISKELAPNRATGTKWDDYSGEPTTSESGKTGQVTLPNLVLPGQTRTRTENPQPSGLFSWGKDQFMSRKKVAESHLHTTPHESSWVASVLEPWKGATGRAQIVSPAQEKAPAKTTGITQLTTRPEPLSLQCSTPNSMPVGIKGTVTTTITAGNIGTEGIEPCSGSNSRQCGGDYPQRPRNVPVPSRLQLAPSDVEANFASTTLQDRSGSRFSPTTYTPTEASSSKSSPRPSFDRPGSPASDKVPSIMSRKRPVPSAVAVVKTDRKPTPADLATPRRPAQSSPVAQVQDRIEALGKRRDTLTRRKANVETIIHELTQVIQPSSIAYDIAARDEVKKTVASLNKELAEIKKEEHEIGLKLLKAWKKRDEEGGYGSESSLWVKRVTS